MDSHISLEFKDENRLIDFLKISYSPVELSGICRTLNIDKDDILNKFLPHKENCSNFVDRVRQQGLFSTLFSVLQIKQFKRERFSEIFPEFHTLVIDNEKINQLRSSTFENENIAENYADWIAYSKAKTVLILGKDSPDEHMQFLKGISSVITSIGYHPILIKEQPEISILSNEEKMLVYASISRFVIIEKSNPAGQIDEAKICAFNRVPSIWIQQEGMGDTWMQGDYEVDFKFIKSFKYKISNQSEILQIATNWMEDFLMKKAEFLEINYPWRN